MGTHIHQQQRWAHGCRCGCNLNWFRLHTLRARILSTRDLFSPRHSATFLSHSRRRRCRRAQAAIIIFYSQTQWPHIATNSAAAVVLVSKEWLRRVRAQSHGLFKRHRPFIIAASRLYIYQSNWSLVCEWALSLITDRKTATDVPLQVKKVTSTQSKLPAFVHIYVGRWKPT